MTNNAAADRERNFSALNPHAELVSKIRAGAARHTGLLAILGVNLLLAVVMVILDRRYGVDYWDLVRDTNAIAGQPAYYGIYSNLGVLLWASAAAVALFAWASLVRLRIVDSRLRPLLLGGSFAAVGCLDDLFMLHEHAYLIGVPEKAAMAGYALFLLAFVVTAWPARHLAGWSLLAASLAFLALSVAVDLLYLPIPGSILVEEVFKFTGIAFLAAYLVSLSFSALSQHCSPAR